MRATFSQCLCRRMQTIVYRRHPTKKMSARVRCSVARRPKEFAGKRAKSRASDYGDLTSASKLFERPCCTLHAIWGRLSQIHCYVRARVQLCTWYNSDTHMCTLKMYIHYKQSEFACSRISPLSPELRFFFLVSFRLINIVNLLNYFRAERKIPFDRELFTKIFPFLPIFFLFRSIQYAAVCISKYAFVWRSIFGNASQNYSH